jgi:hypothetical protein
VLGYILGDFFTNSSGHPAPYLFYCIFSWLHLTAEEETVKSLIEEVIRVKERSCGSELRENKRKTKRSRGSLK